MPFKPKDANINRNGRTKGVPNKTTSEIKTLLISVFNANLEQIISNQEKLSIHERLLLNKTLLPYILPNVKSENFSDPLEQPLFSFNEKPTWL